MHRRGWRGCPTQYLYTIMPTWCKHCMMKMSKLFCTYDANTIPKWSIHDEQTCKQINDTHCWANCWVNLEPSESCLRVVREARFIFCVPQSAKSCSDCASFASTGKYSRLDSRPTVMRVWNSHSINYNVRIYNSYRKVWPNALSSVGMYDRTR